MYGTERVPGVEPLPKGAGSAAGFDCNREVVISARRLFGLLFLMDVFFLLTHLLANTSPPPWDRLRNLFDLGYEGTIVAWYAGLKLSVIGLLFFVSSLVSRHSSGRDSFFLAVAGIGFVFLSADEVTVIHERISKEFHEYQFLPRFAGTRGLWIFIYGALGALLFLFFFKNIVSFARRLPRQSLLIALGFSALLLGGVGLEVLYYYKVWTGYSQVAAEEFLELLGTSLILVGALSTVMRGAALVPRT